MNLTPPKHVVHLALETNIDQVYHRDSSTAVIPKLCSPRFCGYSSLM